MNNYIYIDGEKIQINDSQISALRAALEKSTEESTEKDEKLKCFGRNFPNGEYYFIDRVGNIGQDYDIFWLTDTDAYKVANYCTDRDLLTRRALSETLSRLLWRYSMTHDGNKIDWTKDYGKYCIYYDMSDGKFYSCVTYSAKNLGVTYFIDNKTAEKAIEEIVLPFMEEHPEFDPTDVC